MKITIIGHWGGYPKASEASSGYLFQKDGYNLLVDCGSAVLSNLQRFISVKDLDAAIISHYHYDHMADVGPLHYARQIGTILGDIDKTLTIYGHSYDKDGLKRLSLEPYVKGVAYDGSEEISVGPFKIEFCETRHAVKCFAMKIRGGQKTVVYTSDTSYFKELSEFSKGADLILCECNFYSGQDGSKPGHMNSGDAALLARESGVKEIILTHLPQFGNLNDLVDDVRKDYKGEVKLAVKDMVWGG